MRVLFFYLATRRNVAWNSLLWRTLIFSLCFIVQRAVQFLTAADSEMSRGKHSGAAMGILVG